MTPATTVLHCALDARAHNLTQERLVYDAAQLVRRMRSTPMSGEQRRLVTAAGCLLTEFLSSNRAEGEHERVIANVADQLAGVPTPWSIRRVIRHLRDPLADLCNPIIHGARREDAERVVLDIIREAPESLVGSHVCPNLTVRHQLGVAKTTVLWDLVDRAGATS